MSVTPILYEKSFPEGIFRVYDGDPQRSLKTTKQTHSNVVLNVMTPDLALHEADGVCGEWKEIRGSVLAVKTADCLPVLILGERGAAMVHAGWRGLATGILNHPRIHELKPRSVFVGPCIHECCFEVTAEFKAHFPQSPFSDSEGKLHFDLVAEARRQVLHAFAGAAFVDSGECTYCETKYSSFRRDKTTRRIWNCFFPLAE